MILTPKEGVDMVNNITDNLMSRAEHCSIDLAKFIFAFCVVAIHTEPLIHMNTSIMTSLYDIFVGLAVPFFFIASGYLVTQNLNSLNQDVLVRRVKKHLTKLVQFYLIWSIIYVPLAVYGYYLEGDGILKAAVLYIRNLIFQGEHYYSWPLWYLLSSIYAFVVLYTLLKKKAGTVIIGTTIVVFVVMAWGTNVLVYDIDYASGAISMIGKLLQKTVGKGRMFSGTYYVLFGVLVAKYKEWINKISAAGWIVVFGILFFITFFTNVPFINILMNAALFIVVEEISWDCTYGAYLRRSSTVIYYVHMLIFFVYTILVGMDSRYGVAGFVITSVCAMLVAVLLNSRKLKNTKMAIKLFGKM